MNEDTTTLALRTQVSAQLLAALITTRYFDPADYQDGKKAAKIAVQLADILLVTITRPP